MTRILRRHGASIFLAMAWLTASGPVGAGEDPAGTASRPKTVFLIGDSTVKNGAGLGGGGLWGWGNFLGEHLDPARAVVQNRALGGRSSRTYLTEGLWAKVLADIRPGDLVLIQFGHNDGGSLDTGRARASLKGVGEETRDVVPETSKTEETVHTYGWYLRRYVADARARGATPVILSPVPRNSWDAEGKVKRATHDYGGWSRAVALSESVRFVDLNDIVARHYEEEGRAMVEASYFTASDHTHTTEAGARLNALSVVEGLRSSTGSPLDDAWKPEGGSR